MLCLNTCDLVKRWTRVHSWGSRRWQTQQFGKLVRNYIGKSSDRKMRTRPRFFQSTRDARIHLPQWGNSWHLLETIQTKERPRSLSVIYPYLAARKWKEDYWKVIFTWAIQLQVIQKRMPTPSFELCPKANTTNLTDWIRQRNWLRGLWYNHSASGTYNS